MLMLFMRKRGLGLFAVVLVLALTALLQASVSYTITFGTLHRLMSASPLAASATVLLEASLIALMAVLWLGKRKQALFNCIIFSNSLFTLILLGQTYSLARILSGISAHAVGELLVDVALVALINILIFSIWYWIIDPPGVLTDDQDEQAEPWDFMFPQRGSNFPHYQGWQPHYTDYLFLAFTTSFAFSPTDVLPLSRRAKLLMMLQASISIVTLTGIAGSAINILASNS